MKIHKLRITAIISSVITLILIAVVAASIYMTPSPAQAQSTDKTVVSLPRTITVVGEGMVSIEPDIAEANIGVQVSRPTVEAATQEAETIMEAVLAALQEQGVVEADIQTSGFNIFVEPKPVEPQGQSAETDSYRVSNNVMVTIRSLEQVSAVLDAAIEAGANNVFGVNFRVSETGQQESEARQQAMADAQAKAQELADLARVELGQVISVSEVIGGPGVPFGTTLSAVEGIGGRNGAGPISPGELEIRSHLEVVYSLN